MDFDIRKAFAIDFVLQLEILCSNIANFAGVGDDIDFKDVFLVGEILVGYVNWDTREALFENFVMNPTGIGSYACFALVVRERAKYKSRDV